MKTTRLIYAILTVFINAELYGKTIMNIEAEKPTGGPEIVQVIEIENNDYLYLVSNNSQSAYSIETREGIKENYSGQLIISTYTGNGDIIDQKTVALIRYPLQFRALKPQKLILRYVEQDNEYYLTDQPSLANILLSCHHFYFSLNARTPT